MYRGGADAKRFKPHHNRFKQGLSLEARLAVQEAGKRAMLLAADPDADLRTPEEQAYEATLLAAIAKAEATKSKGRGSISLLQEEEMQLSIQMDNLSQRYGGELLHLWGDVHDVKHFKELRERRKQLIAQMGAEGCHRANHNQNQ